MNKEKSITLLKCLLIVFIMFVPNLFASIHGIQNNGQNNIWFINYNFDLGIYSALSWSITAIQVCFPILLLIFLSNESFSIYGFNKIQTKDFVLSLLRLTGLTIIFSLIAGLVYFCINIINNSGINYDILEKSLSQDKNSGLMFLLNIIPILLAAFTEELCFRSYLYTNLNRIIRNEWVCIIISNLLFSIYHIYQGIMGVIIAFGIGMIFSIEFKKHRNIYTLTAFHMLRNLAAFIMRSM